RMWVVFSLGLAVPSALIATRFLPTSATYMVKAPDGHTYQIDGPVGASDEEVCNHLLRQRPDAAAGKGIPLPCSSAPSQSMAQAPEHMVISRNNASLWLKRARVTGEATALWASWCAMFYLAGWSIGWIRRGFIQ